MAKKPAQFSIPGTTIGQPEKRGWIGPVLFVCFVVAMLSASIWLFKKSPPLRPLDCDTSSGMGSLTSWGQCHERE
jgi:hypothetical protein